MRKILLPLISLAMGVSAANSAERVLYLGDSMSLGAFGRTFDESLRKDGHQVFTVVAGGATPYYWLKSHPPILCDIGFWKKTPREESRIRFIKKVPKVEDLLKEINPSVVVVQTGTNLYAELRSRRRSTQENERVVERLIEEMCQVVTREDRRLYWITPPDSHSARYPVALQEKMASIMKRVAGRFGEVYDSRKVTKFTDPYPKTDGIHYGPTEARAWGQLVAADFSNFTGNLSSRGVVVAKAEPIENEPVVVRAVPIEEPEEKLVPRPTERPLPPAANWTPNALGSNGSVVMEMELVAKSEMPKHTSEFTYRRALAVYEWKVIRCSSKNYPLENIRVAHMVYIDKKFTAASRYEPGKRFTVELVPLSRYPSLHKLQRIETLPFNPEIPLFISKLN